MTKYEYELGKTYLSESTPITVSRIPSGMYKISVKKGNVVGEQMLTTMPGTQRVSIEAIVNDWDLSNVTVTLTGDYEMIVVNATISGITGTSPECVKVGLRPHYSSTWEGSTTISDNNPNTAVRGGGILYTYMTTEPVRRTIFLYDADGNVIASKSGFDLVDNVDTE